LNQSLATRLYHAALASIHRADHGNGINSSQFREVEGISVDELTSSKKPKSLAVGYCNPPEETRFKKGQSGNSRGRPKGTPNMATVLERTLRDPAVVTKLEAAINQVMNKAAAGDLKAVQLLAALLRTAQERGAPEAEPDAYLDETEGDVFAEIVRRIKAAGNGEK
jgi:hypothetical protein